MAEEMLDANQDVSVTGDVEAAEAQPSKEEFNSEKVLAMINEAKTAAIAEAEQRAFARSQSLIDKNIARTEQNWQAQYQTLQQRYEKTMADQGVEPEVLEQLRHQTQSDMEVQELRRKAQAYEELRAQTEANESRRNYIEAQCAKYNISSTDTRLNTTDPEAFADSILAIREARLERQAKEAERKGKQDGLANLRDAGALDVTGGGSAMAAPAWSTTRLVPGSEESVIAGHVIHYYRTIKPEELGQKIAKVQQLMKADPTLKAQDAARRVHDLEMTRS